MTTQSWVIVRHNFGLPEYWLEREALWVTDSARATHYPKKPDVKFQSTGGKCWAEKYEATAAS